MLEYAKVILPKVCVWEDLFEKELLKCVSWAENEEMDELFLWCYNTFGEKHPGIFVEVFAGTTCQIVNNEAFSYSVKPHKIRIKHNKIVEAA